MDAVGAVSGTICHLVQKDDAVLPLADAHGRQVQRVEAAC